MSTYFDNLNQQHSVALARIEAIRNICASDAPAKAARREFKERRDSQLYSEYERERRANEQRLIEAIKPKPRLRFFQKLRLKK
jgi:hypothetical protein